MKGLDGNETIEFCEGLFGFEDKRYFLPMMLEEGSDAILYLQSVEDEGLSFIVMNPFLLKEDYHPVLTREDYEKLGTSNPEELSFYVFCVLANTAADCTVDLKCPIAVNVVTRQARQVILDCDEYRFRHALREFQKEGA